MPHFKGIGSRHKSGTGKNKGRQQTTHHDNWCFNCNGCHSNSNNFSLPVMYVSPPLNHSVINPSHLSSGCQQSSRSLYNTPHDNQCFNRKDSNSNINDLTPPLITVTPPFNDSVINTTQLSLVGQQSSSSSHNTTHEFRASSIPGRTSPDPSDTTPPPPTKNGSRNIYGCMVDVSKLTPAQRQQRAVMLLQYYHKLCNTNGP